MPKWVEVIVPRDSWSWIPVSSSYSLTVHFSVHLIMIVHLLHIYVDVHERSYYKYVDVDLVSQIDDVCEDFLLDAQLFFIRSSGLVCCRDY